MKSRFDESRRALLRQSVWTAGRVLVAGEFGRPAARPLEQATAKQEKKKEEEEVAPAEDLMREHGVLNRILLIYEDCLRKLRAPKLDLEPTLLALAAGIVQHFIEDYHEKLEEDYLFPRFEKAGKLVDLVAVLRAQHQAGRKVTNQILALTQPGRPLSASGQRSLDRALREFIRMYRPHEAREDTVLFPALHEIVSTHEYDALGEQFESKERELFGKEGFEGIVERVAGLEKKLGLYDLSQFTPLA